MACKQCKPGQYRNSTWVACNGTSNQYVDTQVGCQNCTAGFVDEDRNPLTSCTKCPDGTTSAVSAEHCVEDEVDAVLHALEVAGTVLGVLTPICGGLFYIWTECRGGTQGVAEAESKQLMGDEEDPGGSDKVENVERKTKGEYAQLGGEDEDGDVPTTKKVEVSE